MSNEFEDWLISGGSMPGLNLQTVALPDSVLLDRAVAARESRSHSFANPPTNCRHELVYCKQDDDMHCHYCDKFMYRLDQD